VKGWLARAVAGTVLRGEQRRNRFARWAHWYPKMPVVDSRRFQGPGEPYPRHWRAFPQPWPPVTGDDPALQRVLARELAGLPRTWQAVVRERDGAGRPPGEVRARLGLSGTQQRAIRNRAWAVLRERLAARLSREGPA
jgi:RNA polymerase sigma-70 factor (ECF subfamily)